MKNPNNKTAATTGLKTKTLHLEDDIMTAAATKCFIATRFLAIALATASLVALATTPVTAFHPSGVGVSRSSKVSCSRQRIRNTCDNSDCEFVLLAQNDNGNDDTEEPGVMANLMKDTQDLTVDDWVVAKRDLPSLGIRAGAAYKIRSIFLKGTVASESTGLGVETIPLETYGDETRVGYTKYLKVYNPRDHDTLEEKGVLVTPEEIGLTSVKADWTEALFLAVPGFFWVFVAMAFSNYYTDRYGGSFFDAFFRT